MAYSGTAQDRLDRVREAIENCLTSQSLSSTAGSQQMALLRDLRQMEKELEREVGMEANGGSMSSLGVQVSPR